MSSNKFPGRLGLQQRVLPNYRAPFFELLAQSCDSMSLFAGAPRLSEGITPNYQLQITKFAFAKNIHLLNGPLYLCYQRGFKNWLTGFNPDALILEANPRYLATPSAVKWMHARGRKVIGWGLGAPRRSNSTLAGLGVRSRFLNQFDVLISYSQRGADEYASLGFPREKIFVAHNAVASRPASPPVFRPLTFDVRPVIIFVGRLQSRKRVDWLIRACAQLESKPRLIIVGDGEERGALESLAREIYPTAEFVGAKHAGELSPYFAQADLFVLPGTGGLAVQEAMAHGLPVIVAQGDGTQDDLVRAGNGWQIPPENFIALVAAIKTALSDTARLRRMGEESFRIVREEINIEKMVEVFVRALNETTRL